MHRNVFFFILSGISFSFHLLYLLLYMRFSPWKWEKRRCIFARSILGDLTLCRFLPLGSLLLPTQSTLLLLLLFCRFGHGPFKESLGLLGISERGGGNSPPQRTHFLFSNVRTFWDPYVLCSPPQALKTTLIYAPRPFFLGGGGGAGGFRGRSRGGSGTKGFSIFGRAGGWVLGKQNRENSTSRVVGE